MSKFRTLLIFGTAAALGSACAHGGMGTAAGSVGASIDPADASKSVVLHVENLNQSPMELRATINGRSQFIGSVGGNDTTSVLLDPSWFPTASLYVTALPSDHSGRAVGGPLAAGRGDRIVFTLQPALDLSNAIVRR
jgi:hypothetical protein